MVKNYLGGGKDYCTPSLEAITVRVGRTIMQGSGTPETPSTVGFESIQDDEEAFNW